MIKKLEYFQKEEKGEKILFSRKEQLDQFLYYNLVFAIQNEIVYSVYRDMDCYKIVNAFGKFKNRVSFEYLIGNYDLAVIDPEDIVKVAEKL